jgi:hypothetical protein
MSKVSLTAAAFAVLFSHAAWASVVSERWGEGPLCRHAGTARFAPAPGGGIVVEFDLSALPKGARIYRARLIPLVRPDGFPLAEPLLVQALVEPLAEKSAPVVEEAALTLAGPRFCAFDATDVVRRWSTGKLANHGLYIHGPAAAVRPGACLEITYEGRLVDPPSPVTGLSCFYRAGQVFLTWRETDNRYAGREDMLWKDYRDEMLRSRGGKSPVLTYRIYRHTRPITAASLGEAQLLDEVGQFSACDEREVKTEWKGEQVKNVRLDEARVPRTAVEPGKELPVGVGVYVTTTAAGGDYYYAVVSAVNGVENTVRLDAGNTTVQPIHERVAPSEPVFFRRLPMQYQKERTLECFVWWLDEPLANLPGYVHVGVTTGPKKADPAPLLVHAYWWSSGWFTVAPCPQDDGVTLQLDSHPWQMRGIHKGNGTLRAYSQGRVQNYFVRQVKALLPWVQAKYGVDPERIYAFSGGWAWHYPEIFAATFEVLSMNPKRSPAMPEVRRYWGDPQNPPQSEWGSSPYEYWNAGQWIKEHPQAELAFMSYTPSQHLGDFGRLDKPAFYAALRDTRHAFATFFDEGRGCCGTHDAGWIFQIRKSDSIAAFTHGTLDDDPGIGAGGDPGGQINAWLAFDARSEIDRPQRWEATLYLLGPRHDRPGAPLEQCAADVTPRRCTGFHPKPGETCAWTNTSLADNRLVQQGTAVADARGLVTAAKVVISKGRNRLVFKRPEGP